MDVHVYSNVKGIRSYLIVWLSILFVVTTQERNNANNWTSKYNCQKLVQTLLNLLIFIVFSFLCPSNFPIPTELEVKTCICISLCNQFRFYVYQFCIKQCCIQFEGQHTYIYIITIPILLTIKVFCGLALIIELLWFVC